MAVWKIEEPEHFFLDKITAKRDITHPHKRLQHLSGRYLLPFLFPDFPHAEIELADTRKPFLREEQYHFSISHCGDFAAAIVSSTQRVGIDIELFTPRIHRIKHKFLHTDERLFADAQPVEAQTSLLVLLWSAKEAMYKWWGRGDVDFSDMLRLEPFEPAASGTINGQFIKAGRSVSVQLAYRLFDNMTLCWLVSGNA